MKTLNGAAAGGSQPGAAPARDPLEGVLAMGPRIPAGVLALTAAFAILLHAGVAAAATAAVIFADMLAWQRQIHASIEAKLSQTYDVDLVKPPEPEPPPPEPEPEPEKEEPKPEPPPVKQEVPKDEPPPPPPAAAQAGAVMTQEPTPDEPVDLTGNTFVTGSGSTYAGGTTQAGGTSKSAVYSPHAVATGVPGGTGTAPAPPPPPKVDRSRAAGLLGSTDWSDCPFPGEADAEQIDQAYVTIQVKVKPDGTADSVQILQDPGHGFGREARKCAMRKRYTTALDVDGNAVGGTTKPFRVRFER